MLNTYLEHFNSSFELAGAQGAPLSQRCLGSLCWSSAGTWDNAAPVLARLWHRDYNYLSSNDQPGKITVFMLCLENNVLLQIDSSFVCKRASLTVLKQLPLFCIPVPLFAAHFPLGKPG